MSVLIRKGVVVIDIPKDRNYIGTMLLLLLACQDSTNTPIDSGQPDVDIDSGDPVDTAPTVAPVEAAITATAAFDPIHNGRVTIDVAFTEGALARVWVSDADGAEVALLVEDLWVSDDFTWGGKDDSNDAVPAGTYTINVEATLDGEAAVASVETRSIRIGAISGSLTGDRLPLIWHRAGAQGSPWTAPIDGDTFALSALEDSGYEVDIPEPWDELASAPITETVGVNWPAAFAWDAQPGLSLTLDGDLVDLDATLSVVVEGWSLGDGVVAPGEVLSLTRDGALSTGPGVVEETVTIQLLLDDTVVSKQELPLRMYALAGEHTFAENGPSYGAWLSAIDPALRSIEGVAPDDDAVLSGLVEFIYRDLGLRYDTDYGASSYVSYQGGSWTRAHFNFSAFLAKANGEVINCTDAAAILGGYANMLGVDLSYLILNPSFDLNYILAVGGTEYTRCPFGPGGCGFSYHAVTSPDGGQSIFDATLAIDGDGDPRNLPSTEQLVQGVTGQDYFDAIVRAGSPSYHSESKGTIQ
ncbi:MAG: hypothetical protein ACI8RZ_002876 [Myxococcota bacterium]